MNRPGAETPPPPTSQDTSPSSSQLWVPVHCLGLLLGSFWFFTSVYLGMGWEGSTCRARHLSFSKAYRLPPFLQHMCTTCKVYPLSRNKESPPSVKMVGARKGQEHPSL